MIRKLLVGIIVLVAVILIYVSLQLPVQQPFGVSADVSSPSDRLQENQISVYNDRVIIHQKDVKWARFTDTNSMDPIIDADSHALEIVPQTPSEIEVGDIIAYRFADRVIIHRVVETGEDLQGWYAIAKGDNNPNSDPLKVRFHQITGVVIGILY